MRRSVFLVFALVLMSLHLNACAEILQGMARNESAGYLGCPARDVTVRDLDPFGRSYRAECHGRAMVCSATGDNEHRQVHCADAAQD